MYGLSMVQTTLQIIHALENCFFFFFWRKSKIKICFYLLPFFLVFKTTPDFAIIFKNRAFKTDILDRQLPYFK